MDNDRLQSEYPILSVQLGLYVVCILLLSSQLRAWECGAVHQQSISQSSTLDLRSPPMTRLPLCGLKRGWGCLRRSDAVISPRCPENQESVSRSGLLGRNQRV